MAETPETNKAQDELKQAPVEAAETIREAAQNLEDSPAVEAFASAKEALVEGIEKIAPAPEQDPHAGPAHFVGSTTTIRGLVIPLPVYTVVFIILGALTAFEVLLAQGLPHGVLTTPLLVISSLTKAALVVWFYMHLNRDSRVFALTLILPVVMVILATVFLWFVPVGY
ncbi:MAG TPA: cytochrome C oxidase subunit IV family protein [Phototrophicaceae bacterium]|nr:cytochrome C oxidase subunit IV family protein [Phototrophicaceae bacterium]